MKKTNIIFWVSTILVAGLFGMSAVSGILSADDSVKLIVNQMGYPKYILPFLGVAKALAIIAILVPGFPRIKEWAYAGLAFDLAGAMYSSIALGEPVKAWIWFVLFFLVLGISYTYYHRKLNASRRLVNQ
ncbi:MAG TPA: DoxX family protein [Puia sp.]